MAEPGEQRTEHDDRGPHLLDLLVGRLGVTSAGGRWSAPRPRGRRETPIERRRSAIAPTSPMRGDVAQHEGALRQDGGGHELEHRVLRPQLDPTPGGLRWGARRFAPSGPQYARCRPSSRARTPPHRGHGPQHSRARPGRTRNLLQPWMDVVTEQVGDGGGPGTDPETGAVTAHFEAAGPLPTLRGAVEARPRPDGRFDVTERSIRPGDPGVGPLRAGLPPRAPPIDRRDSPGTRGRAPPTGSARAARGLGLLCTCLVAGYLGTVVTLRSSATDTFGRATRPGQPARGRAGRGAPRPGLVSLADRQGRRGCVIGAAICAPAHPALGAWRRTWSSCGSQGGVAACRWP